MYGIYKFVLDKHKQNFMFMSVNVRSVLYIVFPSWPFIHFKTWFLTEPEVHWFSETCWPENSWDLPASTSPNPGL